MSIFVSAGHHLKDSGAVYGNRAENMFTIRVRNRVISILNERGQKVITDVDTETLPEYLRRIKPGDGSVVCEFHFDAAGNGATGTSAFYKDGASKNSKDFAAKMCLIGANTMGIKNRGAQSESDSHRGRLGLVHEEGINCLVEVCFIDNDTDMAKFEANFDRLCDAYAQCLIEFENLIL